MTDSQPIRVEIYSDPICPWCYIGKRRFHAALESRTALELEITWMPFQLNPDMPEEGMDRQTYLERKFGGAVGAKSVYDPIVDAGRSSGIDFDFEAIVNTPNTMHSHRLIHYSKQHGRQDQVTNSLFRAYFERGDDIGEIEMLVECATEAGLEASAARDYLDSDEDFQQITAQDMMARQMGVQGVPLFVFERKYAVSGAQSPEVFGQVLDRVVDEIGAAAD